MDIPATSDNIPGTVVLRNNTGDLSAGAINSGQLTARVAGFGGLDINSNADFGNAEIITRKSRGNSVTPLIVNAGDIVMTLAGQGYDGSTYRNAAFILFAVDATPGAGDMPGNIILSTTADGASSPTERLRINSSGNVGIGTNTPATTLEVRNPTSNTEYLRVGSGSVSDRALRLSAFVVAGTNNVGHDLNAPEANGVITLSTASTERLRIKASGQVRFRPLTSDPTSAVEAGDVYYNSSTNKLRVHNGTSWVDLH